MSGLTWRKHELQHTWLSLRDGARSDLSGPPATNMSGLLMKEVVCVLHHTRAPQWDTKEGSRREGMARRWKTIASHALRRGCRDVEVFGQDWMLLSCKPALSPMEGSRRPLVNQACIWLLMVSMTITFCGSLCRQTRQDQSLVFPVQKQ